MKNNIIFSTVFVLFGIVTIIYGVLTLSGFKFPDVAVRIIGITEVLAGAVIIFVSVHKSLKKRK